jgi:hypothetical protein
MSAEGLVLRAARGDQAVRSREIDDGPISIGSWAGATLPLDDASLAPVQAILDPDGRGRWRLICLTDEGCQVNGRPVRRGWVTAADRLTVGGFEVAFSGRAKTPQAMSPVSRAILMAEGSERPLRAVLRWQGTPIDARVLEPGALLSFGRGRHVTFDIPEGDGRCWAVATCLDGQWHVALDAPTRALNAHDDRPLLSAEPRTDGPKLPRGFVAGKLWAPLHEGTRVRLASGALSIDIERCDQFEVTRIDRVPGWATQGGQLLIITSLTVLCFFAMLWITPKDLFKEILDAQQRHDLMVQYLRPPPPVELKEKPTHFQKKKEESEGVAKAQGEEGKAGRTDAPDVNARRGGPKSDAEVVKNQALLKALSSGATAQLLSGGSLNAANSLGHLDGPAVGDAQGSMGLGLRGQGSGGGGLSADTVGVGPIGTKGVGLGAAASAGKVGRGGQSDLGIDEPASVQGGLDREVIRRVIISHRPQIRYCYEKQLSNTPDLVGKVLVEFVIAGDGSVSTAHVSEQTLSDAEVGKCIVSKVKTWSFPKPKGNGTVVVTYPFLFKPSGQGAR